MADKNPGFKKRLNEEFRKSGWKPPKFAKKMETNYTTMKNYLDKGVVPAWPQLLTISKNTGRSIEWLLTGHGASKSPPEWTFDDKVRDSYDFLQKVVSEANEGAREGRSVVALCELIKNRIEDQLIKLEDKPRKTRLPREIRLNNYRRRKEDRP